MSPAVILHTGMCRSEALFVKACERETYRWSYRQKRTESVFLTVEPQLRFSQGHPLTSDIHGARLSLSLGRFPSAPTDKTGYFMCRRQTPWLCIVWLFCD